MLKENLEGLEMCTEGPIQYQQRSLTKTLIYDP